LVRTCIMTLTSSHSDTSSGPFPLPLATALFSFLYHLASYEAGGEALVSCGMMESLLRVINWPGTELEHITVSIIEVYFLRNIFTCVHLSSLL
jgi:E3 ubiquitin-protein ligase HUWE1